MKCVTLGIREIPLHSSFAGLEITHTIKGATWRSLV